MNLSDHQKGLFITFFGVILVVPDSLFVRLISAEPMVTAFWRGAAAGSFILIGILIIKGFSGFRNVVIMGWVGWLYAVLIGSTAPAFVLAISKTTVANVVFILASMPIFSALFSRLFLNEPFKLRTLVTTLFVLLGLSFIAFGSTTSNIASWKGDIWALYVSIAYAAALTAVRKLKAFSMIPAIPIAYIGAAGVIYIFFDPFTGFADNWPLYIGHGLFIASATCLLTVGPRFISSPEVALLILLESVLAPLLVWVVIGENPGHWALIGGAVVLCSLFISNLMAFRRIGP